MTASLSSVTFALALTTRILFSVMSGFFFSPRAGVPLRLKALFVFSPVCYVAELVLLHNAAAPPVPTAAGGVLYLTALAIFSWAAWTHRSYRPSPIYSPDLAPRLVSDGPYRYIRHPYYSAYLLAYCAGVSATGGSVYLVALLLFNTLLYVRAAAAEEARFLASPLGREYASYHDRTGMFLPVLRRSVRTGTS